MYAYGPALILHNGLMQAVRFNAPLDVQARLLIAAEEAREIDAKSALLAQASVSQIERGKLWGPPEAPQSP